jgi:TatD DNase family protein
MKLIDTHAHLYDSHLIGQLPEVLHRAREAGIETVLVIGTDLANSRQAVELAAQHPELRAVVGFQPNHCAGLTDDDWLELVQLTTHPRVVGIGETGLDRYWDDCPFDIQQQWFEKHLLLSQSTGLPLVIHMRDCEADIVEFLEQHQNCWPISGVMHSFTGSWETAAACLAAGLHISFAGMLTFKASEALRHVARQVPDDRILIETDSPYLSPEPLRGKRPNEPARVLHTAQCLAQVRGVPLIELANSTTENAQKLFCL